MGQRAHVPSILAGGPAGSSAGRIPGRSSTVEQAPDRPVSVERVLSFVDRQIDSALHHGTAAVAEDALAEDRADLTAVLSRLPARPRSATITRVDTREWRTTVEIRCLAPAGSFSIISTWDLGPGDRPWIIDLRTIDPPITTHRPQPDDAGLPSQPTPSPLFSRRRQLLAQPARKPVRGPGRPRTRIQYYAR